MSHHFEILESTKRVGILHIDKNQTMYDYSGLYCYGTKLDNRLNGIILRCMIQ